MLLSFFTPTVLVTSFYLFLDEALQTIIINNDFSIHSLLRFFLVAFLPELL